MEKYVVNGVVARGAWLIYLFPSQVSGRGVGNPRGRVLGKIPHEGMAGFDHPSFSSSSFSPWHLLFAPDALWALDWDQLGRGGMGTIINFVFLWEKWAMKGSRTFRSSFFCKTQVEHQGHAEGISPALGHCSLPCFEGSRRTIEALKPVRKDNQIFFP